MKKKNKLKKHRGGRHKKAPTEEQLAQGEKVQFSGSVEPDTSMIQEEIEHIATDTHSQQSFFEPVGAGIGREPLELRPRVASSLRDALRKQGRRQHGSRIHWKAVRYDEGHLHPGALIRGKDIIPPDRE